MMSPAPTPVADSFVTFIDDTAERNFPPEVLAAPGSALSIGPEQPSAAPARRREF